MKNRREFIAQSGMLGLASMINPGSIVPKTNSSTTIKKPHGLKPGDKIGVMAPGGAVFSPHYINKFKATLADLGFKTEIGRTCYKRDGQFGGTDEERASEFMRFIQDPTIKAIFTMRGGSGCARILPLLDYSVITNHPKIVMGFSDITSIVNGVFAQCGLVGFHGPVGYSSWGAFTRKSFKDVCTNSSPSSFNFHPESEPSSLYDGIATGALVGGNLTVLSTLAGTPYLPMGKNQIVFLEDIDEEPYAIDRYLTQLIQCGFLQNASGIILGNFRRCVPEEPDKSHSLLQTFKSNLLPLKVPILLGADFGHTKHKWTLPIGVKAKLNTNDLSLKLLEAAVV